MVYWLPVIGFRNFTFVAAEAAAAAVEAAAAAAGHVPAGE
jgi:hypothetical protein